jgi:hypothetical protein
MTGAVGFTLVNSACREATATVLEMARGYALFGRRTARFRSDDLRR